MKPRSSTAIALFAGLALVAPCLPAPALASGHLASGQQAPAPSGAGGMFVHFRAGTRHQGAVLRAYGLTPVVRLSSVDVVYARGAAAAYRHVARDRRVTHLEADEALPLLNDTSVTATRVDELRRDPAPLRDPSGAILD
ncbi:MAG: hypothetical protein M3271_06360, partial [Actinomycetota bacterium]|nr:hypothetical protein [Actinomycetota bacterium]